MHVSTLIFLCSAANFINAADRVIMPIAIIPMAKTFGWDLHHQGWVLSAFAIGYMSSQLFGGASSRKWGGKSVLAAAVTLWSISTLVTPLVAHSFWLLFTARLFLGIGEGIGMPAIFHIFGGCVPMEHRSRAMAYITAAGSIGQTIATIVCPHLDWADMFRLFGFLGLGWTVIWLWAFRETASTSSLPEFQQQQRSCNDQSLMQSPSWRALISHWPLWAVYVAHFSMNWTSYTIMHWLPTYLHTTLQADSHSLMFTALPYLFNSLAGIAVGHWSDRLVLSRRLSLLSVRRLATVCGLAIPALLLLAFAGTHSLTAAVVFISLSMAFLAANCAGHYSNHAELAPHHAGLTFALSNTIATIPGVLCGPLTAYLVTESAGRWSPVFVLAAALDMTAAAVYCSQSSVTQLM